MLFFFQKKEIQANKEISDLVVKVKAGEETLSNKDELKSLCKEFRKYLSQEGKVKRVIFQRQVTHVKDVLTQQIVIDRDERKIIVNMNVSILKRMNQEEGKGYFLVKRQTSTANYVRKMTEACMN